MELIRVDDEPSDSTTIIKKILGAKLFDEGGEGWKRNVRDIDGEILCGMPSPLPTPSAYCLFFFPLFSLPYLCPSSPLFIFPLIRSSCPRPPSAPS